MYCELFPWDAPAEQVLALQPQGLHPIRRAGFGVRAGGAAIPGLCAGERAARPGHLLRHAGPHPRPGRPGGRFQRARIRAGPGRDHCSRTHLLIPGTQPVWMSHGDRIENLPPGFTALAQQRQLASGRHGRPGSGAITGCSSTLKCTTPRRGKKCCAALWWRSAAPRPIGRPNSIITESVERIRQPGGQRGGAVGSQRRRGFQRGNCHGAARRGRPACGGVCGYRPAAPG